MHRIESYFRLAIIFIILMTILFLPVAFFLKKRGKNIPRQISYLALFCSLFLIVFATILFAPINFHSQEHMVNLIPFVWTGYVDNIQQFIVEKLPNILLFIPLGFFLPIVFKNMRCFYKCIFVSFLFTFSIEFIQYFIGRSSDIDDIITNLLGAIIGYVIYKICDQIFKKKIFWMCLCNNGQK